MASSWTTERARYSALSRHRGPDAPATIEARDNLDSALAENHITRAIAEIVDQAPRLSEAARDRLATLLRGSP